MREVDALARNVIENAIKLLRSFISDALYELDSTETYVTERLESLVKYSEEMWTRC
ncbi:50S ribosomal protein L18 domain protein [Dictyocaulus viviparus]|uniref:50S ribosomal protein L18 domain protein n=1 Tax=Dictyocaulus viviparus TaxID=29172 RepID=A0A0D8XSK4_DICVI|nr:50S ribosomal protein L18 domain protein [Dictyocaulus viviparus]